MSSAGFCCVMLGWVMVSWVGLCWIGLSVAGLSSLLTLWVQPFVLAGMFL